MSKLPHRVWSAGLLLWLAASPVLAQRPGAVAPLVPVRPAVRVPGPVVPALPASGSALVGRLPGFFTNRPLSAPTAASAAPVVKRPEPVIILNSRLVISYAEFAALDPYKIEKLAIYEGDNAPDAWRSLVKNGVVYVLLKVTLPYASVRVAALGRWLRLRRPLRYELNGQPLQDLTLRISRAALAGFDLGPATGAASGRVLNIRLLQSQPASRPAVPGKPGEFYIRGLAQF